MRLLIITGLVLALLCVAAANSLEHFHRGAETAANCRICQIAHVPMAPVSARVILAAPTWATAEITRGLAHRYFAPQLSQAHSRAPPA